MRRRPVPWGAVILSFALCLAAGIWLVTPERAIQPEAILSAIPETAGSSGSDRAIARRADEARRNSREEAAWAHLGDALMQKAEETLDVGYYSVAGSSFRRALVLNGDFLGAMIGMARVEAARGQPEQSAEWARRAIARDSKDPTAYGLLGDAAMARGDYDTASSHYQKMLDVRADSSSYRRTARLLFLQGDVRKATWLMREAIESAESRAEDTARYHAELALMLWSNGAGLPAEQVLEAALEDSPHDYHLLLTMAKVKTSPEDHDLAIVFYEKALSIAPGYEALVGLGDLYALSGRKEEAEAHYARVEAIHRSNRKFGVDDRLQMARFYADHDRNLSEALELAEDEFQARPSVYAADTLAWCYFKNGREKDARMMIAKALSRRTPEASFLFHAGMIHARSGDPVSARKYLYQALSLNPNFHPAGAKAAADTLSELGAVTRGQTWH